MEEKLYFRPANYGKGLKKRKEKPAPAKKQTDGEKNHRARNLALFLALLAVIVAVILWLLRGQTTTTGQYPANIRNEALTCRSGTIVYDKVSNINSANKSLKISMIFTGEEQLSSASLEYALTFSSYSEAYSAEAVSHAQFNLGLQALGYDAGKFNNKFSILDNKLIITLSASSDKNLDDTTRGYFLIEYTDGRELPKSLGEYRQNYERQGFACTSTINQ